jgi:hypothetical protein
MVLARRLNLQAYRRLILINHRGAIQLGATKEAVENLSEGFKKRLCGTKIAFWWH